MRRITVKKKGKVRSEEARVVKFCFSCRCFSAGKRKKTRFGR